MKSLEELCAKSVDALLEAGYLQKETRTLYIYTLQLWALRLATVWVIFVINSLIWGVVPSLAFYLPFLAIRRRAGGFHASTPTRCMLLSFAVAFGGIGFSVLAMNGRPPILIGITNVISFFLVKTFCTGGPPDYAETERKMNRKAAYRSVIVFGLISVICSLSPPTAMLGRSMCVGIGAAAAATIPSKR